MQVREIATQKMFLIHNALGEDSKIFDADEEPTPSGLFNKINESPDEEGEVSIATQIRNKYNDICNEHPEVIKKISELPTRVKSGKSFSENQVCVLRHKGLSLFTHFVADTKSKPLEVNEIMLEEFLNYVSCNYETPHKSRSEDFWPAYNEIKEFKPSKEKVS